MESPNSNLFDLRSVTPVTSSLPSPTRLSERFNTIPWSPEDSFDAMVRDEINKLDSLGWPSAVKRTQPDEGSEEEEKESQHEDKKKREEGDDFALFWNCPICGHTNPAKNLYCDECETRKSPSTLYYAIYKI